MFFLVYEVVKVVSTCSQHIAAVYNLFNRGGKDVVNTFNKSE